MPTVTRTNECTCPSFEAGITGWVAGGNPAPAIASSTDWSFAGTRSLKITWAAGNTFFPGAYYAMSCVVGVQYTVSVRIKTSTIPVQLLATANGLFTGSAISGTNTSTAGQVLSVTFTATAVTHNISLCPGGVTPSGGQVTYLDAILIERAPVAASYFDGSFSGCQWTGTAGLSSSQQLSGPLTLTVVNDPTNSPPRRILYLTGAPGTTAQITRTDADGAIRPVRGGDPAPLVGGQWVGYDFEGPYGQAATYTVTPSDGSPAVFTLAPALGVTQAWLVHEGVPSLSIKVIGWHDDSGRGTDTGEAQHVVIGRENPIIITDGQRKGASYQASLKTNTEAEAAAFLAIIAGSVPLLLQLVYPFTGRSRWEYISIGHVDELRRSEQFGDVRRKWAFTCTVVDRPAGGIAAQRTIADAAIEVGTIDQYTARYKTITGATVGIPGT